VLNTELTKPGADRVQLLYRNAKQIKKIVEATYQGVGFDEKPLESGHLDSVCSSSAVS
jgi:ethanolaminephosphotransferase